MATDTLGLYVHIPFCVRKCNYCDFCSFNISLIEWRDKYIDRLCEEIASYKNKGIRLDTVFFGGGTPSLLTPEEFVKIFHVIKDSFEISEDAEITVEANPKTLDCEKLSAFGECGVNRLSIGLQSVHENELKILGRIHNFEDFLASYNLAREYGIDNINVDLMYGIPEQTMKSFSDTLSAVLSLKPEHISLYGLILEEGTPFFDGRESLSLPSEENECDMYYFAADMLRSAGYSHYEISNYSLPDKPSRHNLKYWRCQEYIGVGVAAYSYFEGKRYGNSNCIEEYLAEARTNYDKEAESPDEAYEYVMLRLRLAEGFSLFDYRARFGVDFLDNRMDLIDSLVNAGYIAFQGDRIALTERGFYVSNSILTELI